MNEVIRKGDPDCKHEYIYFIEENSRWQRWWCDNPQCRRHETMDIERYTKERLSLPPNAYIRTPDHPCGEGAYVWKTDDEGKISFLSSDKILYINRSYLNIK